MSKIMDIARKFLGRKTEEKVAPRTLRIPKEHIPEFLELVDAYNVRQARGAARARYNLWDFVENIFPETKEGSWRYDVTSASNPVIREVIHE